MLFNFQGPIQTAVSQTARLLYHADFHLSIGFLSFFQRFFFRKTCSFLTSQIALCILFDSLESALLY